MGPVIRRHSERLVATAEQRRTWTRAALSAAYFCAVLAVVAFFLALKLPDVYGLWQTLTIGAALTVLTFGILVFVGIGAGTEAFVRPESRVRRPIQFYYLATPLFVLVDIVFGYSFRAPSLSSEPAIRYVYYGLAFGLGVFLLWRPRFTEFAALTESSLALILLIADLYLAITAFDRYLPEHVSAAEASALYTEKLVGFLIYGALLTAAVLRRTDAIDDGYKHSPQGLI